MSKYVVGVDVGHRNDYSAYTLCRSPFWWEQWLRKLKLSKATWEVKVVRTWTEDSDARK